MKILIVEDNIATRLLLQTQLVAFGNQTRDAGSLLEARTLLDSEQL